MSDSSNNGKNSNFVDIDKLTEFSNSLGNAKLVVLDTNFVMIPGSLGVDIYTELSKLCDFKYSSVVLDKTLDELEVLLVRPGEKGKTRDSVRLSKSIMERQKTKGLKIVQSKHIYKSEYVDDILKSIAAADKDDILIFATIDKELASALMNAGKRVITLRQRKYLVFK